MNITKSNNSVSEHFLKFAMLESGVRGKGVGDAGTAGNAPNGVDGANAPDASVEAATPHAALSPSDGTKGGAAAGEKDGTSVEKDPGRVEAEEPPNGWLRARKDFTLKTANAAERDLLLLASKGMTLAELVRSLGGCGIQTTISTLQRYLAKWRGEKALDEAEDRKGTVERFAAHGKDAATRAGALAAAREKVFDAVVNCGSREEALRIYQALAGEEERLRKLELEDRKTRAQERTLALQEERVRLEGARGKRLFMEALRILRDAALEDGVKIARMRERLEEWKAGAIEVEAGAQLKIEN